ncbi:hypothetical protein BC361_19625 [Ensifer sp. LC54]|nr:hypothetical protein BC361_19625 [Ensifer sp. LC54]
MLSLVAVASLTPPATRNRNPTLRIAVFPVTEQQMGYDWNGARWRRMTAARFGTAVALASLLVAVATQVVTRAL